MIGRTRTYGLVMAALLMAGLIGWAGTAIWQQLRQLRAGFILFENNKVQPVILLDSTEHVALYQFLDTSNRTFRSLQRLFVVCLILLVGFAATMILSLYRSMILPLRVKLGESRAIIERDEKLAALGTMAAGMAHEIRNPLTAVNVRLHSLTRTLLPGSSEHEDATIIGRELQRLDRILRQFLRFARPADPKLVTVSVDYLLRKVHAILAPHLAKAAIGLEVRSTPNTWIHVDPDQIEQVLVNLIKNAAESIGQEGNIILRAQVRTNGWGERTSPVVLLEVSDTGPGVPPEVQPRLFDPFFTTKEGGTGLGLPIAARIVKQHAGTLICNTATHHGATFSVLLPLAEKHLDEIATHYSAR